MRSPSSPFHLRGIVESFYGTYYTFPERNDLINFAAKHGANFYLYGPKNDRQHRTRWWEPYPPEVLDDFEATINLAGEAGVTFCYAISFGTEPDYTSEQDFAAAVNKLRALFDRGCRAFAVLFDDLPETFSREVNRDAYPGIAEAHADWSNRFLRWATDLDPSCTLAMCPTEYCGTPPFSEYSHALGRLLAPAIDVLYTGPEVCSLTITRNDVTAFGEAVGRAPLIWDNYPVNDGGMRFDLHMAPFQGRSPDLFEGCRGLLANPMGQMEASKPALHTVFDYLREPAGYQPGAFWQQALLEAAGEASYPALLLFAENSVKSPLHRAEQARLTVLVNGALAVARRRQDLATSPAGTALTAYLDALDEGMYHLKNRMRNLALRQNMVPWIETLESRLWLCRRALTVLAAIDAGQDLTAPLRVLEECIEDTQTDALRPGGPGPLALARYARSRARRTLKTRESAD